MSDQNSSPCHCRYLWQNVLTSEVLKCRSNLNGRSISYIHKKYLAGVFSECVQFFHKRANKLKTRKIVFISYTVVIHQFVLYIITWVLGRCGGLGGTPSFLLVTVGEPSFLMLWVRESGNSFCELWDTADDSSTVSPPIADRQLWSEMLKGFMLSPDDSVLSTEVQTRQVSLATKNKRQQQQQKLIRYPKNSLTQRTVGFPMFTVAVTTVLLKMKIVDFVVGHDLIHVSSLWRVPMITSRRQRATARRGRWLAEGGGGCAAGADGMRSGMF